MFILVALSPACNSQLSIAISFGGPAWPISLSDLNLGPVSNGLCLGAIFDITAGSNVKPTPGTPQWIVGDTFLVRIFCDTGLSGILTGLFFLTGHRKMCTRSSAPIRPQWALHNFQTTPQVRNVSSPVLLLFYTWVGIRVMSYSYVPLRVFLPTADQSSPSIRVVSDMSLIVSRFRFTIDNSWWREGDRW